MKKRKKSRVKHPITRSRRISPLELLRRTQAQYKKIGSSKKTRKKGRGLLSTQEITRIFDVIRSQRLARKRGFR
jgi:hypothetical protein